MLIIKRVHLYPLPHPKMEPMAIYVDFVQGEIEELSQLLGLLDPRLATPDWMEIRRLLVVRHSLVIAMHESLLENWLGLVAPSRNRKRRQRNHSSLTPDLQVPTRF